MTRKPFISTSLAQAIRLTAVLAILAPSAWAQSTGQAPGQDPVPAPQARSAIQAREIVKGLEHPWAIAFFPGSTDALITERPGRLRLLRNGELAREPVAGTPEVFAKGQGGLLDVALSPDFVSDRRVYLAYAEAGEDGKAGTAIGYGRLSEDGDRLSDFRVIFRQTPKLSSGHHFGARLVFDGKGHLYATLGENNQRPTAQDLDKLQGKVIRLDANGGIPADNPFAAGPSQGKSALDAIWSYGHRNPQGAALNPWNGELWVNEHGPRGGDEINRVRPGENYGWPLATYGRNYTGFAIPEAEGSHVDGTAQPAYYWSRSPAISGMAFYDSDRFPAWRRSVFIGALKEGALIRLQLDGERVVSEEWLLQDLKERIRDVRQGYDGYVYVLTDSPDGKLLRIGLTN